MKRTGILGALVVSVALLVGLGSPASGKPGHEGFMNGSANISGPGLGGGAPLVVEGKRLEDLMRYLGPSTDDGLLYRFVPRMSLDRPSIGELGPAYDVEYTLVFREIGSKRTTTTLHQKLYPYAPEPILGHQAWAYTPPGQYVAFGGDRYEVTSGWSHSSSAYLMLVEVGLPKDAPVAAGGDVATGTTQGGSSTGRVWIAMVAMAALLLAGALTARGRRRTGLPA